MTKCRSDTLFGFFDRCVRETDDLDGGEGFITIDFDTYFIAL